MEPSSPLLMTREKFYHICVGCGAKAVILEVPGMDRIQPCPNPKCGAKAMLPQDAEQVEVLQLRIRFLEQTSERAMRELIAENETLTRQVAELKDLKQLRELEPGDENTLSH